MHSCIMATLLKLSFEPGLKSTFNHSCPLETMESRQQNSINRVENVIKSSQIANYTTKETVIYMIYLKHHSTYKEMLSAIQYCTLLI